MLRVGLLPFSDDLPSLHEADGDRRFSTAVEVAAPGLLDPVPEGRSKRRAQQSRAIKRYLRRSATRPTPFGLFAGVGFFPLDGDSLVSLHAGHLVPHARPDAEWLAHFIAEAVDGDYAEDHLKWNPFASENGSRMALQAGQMGVGAAAIRIRRTKIVESVKTAAASAVAFEDLVESTLRDHPDLERDKVASVINALVSHGFLLPSTTPSLLTDSPAEDLATQLSSMTSASARGHAAELREVIARLMRLTATDPDQVRDVRSHMRALTPNYRGKDFIQVDSKIAGSGAIPAEVGVEAARTVDFLSTVCLGAGDGSAEFETYLDSFRQRFVEKFGTRLAIPITQLLSDDHGIGSPPHYLSDAPATFMKSRGAVITEYERTLFDLLQETEASGSTELRIDAAVERRLVEAVEQPQDGRPVYPTIDLFGRILSRETGTGGLADDWLLVLNREAVSGGLSAFGRFLYLADNPESELLSAVADSRERASAPAVIAEADFRPSVDRTANVGTRRPMHGLRVAVSGARGPGAEHVVGIEDIYVWADFERFFLRSRSLDAEIEVVDNTVLNPTVAPHAVRLMVDISRSRFRPFGGFSWGPFEDSQRLPRVVRGRTVLRQAAWTFLSRQAGEPAAFADQMAAWRRQWRVPRLVCHVSGDHRLLVDLDDADDLADLFSEQRRAKLLRFEEFLSDGAAGWLRDGEGRSFLSEVVLPVSTDQGAAIAVDDAVRPCAYDDPSRSLRDASEWLYVRLYLSESAEDDFLVGELRLLIASLREKAFLHRWFYIRYDGSGPHLRVRMKFTQPGGDQGLAELLDRIRRWKADGVIARWEMDEYTPEYGRYGGHDVYDSVEALFERCSDLAIDVRRRELAGEGEHSIVSAVRVMDRLYSSWGLSAPERVDRNPVGPRPPRSAGEAGRSYFKAQRAALVASVQDEDSSAAPRQTTTEEWAAFARAASAAAETVRRAARQRRLVGREDEILQSIAHMAVNRLMTPDRQRESAMYVAWRLALIAARSESAAAGRSGTR